MKNQESFMFWIGFMLGAMLVGAAAFIGGGEFMRHYGPCDISGGG